MDYIDTKVREIGNPEDFKRNSLKGYVAERTLVRMITKNKEEIEDYLKEKYNISKLVSLKIKEEKEDRDKRLKYNSGDPYETYASSDLLISKLISLDANNCIEALDIYDYEGVRSFIDFIQKNFPILRL